MGCSIATKSCLTNANVIAPNPSPQNWELIKLYNFANGYVLKVKYIGCNNFEGIKLMVYRGKYINRSVLDPHFADDEKSPIARFKPTEEGVQMALDLANSF